MKIRKATLKDIPGLILLWRGQGKYHQKLVAKNKDEREQLVLAKNAEKTYKNWIKKLIQSRNGFVLVAQGNDGKIIGCCVNKIETNKTPIFKIKKLGHISELYIIPRYRKKGIASLLKKNAFEWFKKKGLSYASLGVRPKNKQAWNIYKKWGFFEYRIEMRKKL